MIRLVIFLAVSLIWSASPALAQDLTEQCPVPVMSPAPGGPPDPEVLVSHRTATGAGVKVAVIDTGVAAHPRLGSVIAGADFITGGAPEAALHDCDGHGTIVAGIIAARPDPKFQDSLIGIAPDAEIIAIRQSSSVLRSRDQTQETAGTIATLADAIDRALDVGVDIINVSLASCVPPAVARSVDTSVLDRALQRAESSGVIVVAAAGNIGPHCPEGSVSFPASAPTVLAVSASESNYHLAGYSLAVDKPRLSAPGSIAVGLSPTGQGFASGMATEGAERPFTGTSFAAPKIAGMAAQLKERYPQDSAPALRARVYAAASPGTGDVTPSGALSQLTAPVSTKHTQVKALTPASQRVQLRSFKIVLLSMCCAGGLAIVVATRRRLRG